jgi:hypothetical protein
MSSIFKRSYLIALLLATLFLSIGNVSNVFADGFVSGFFRADLVSGGVVQKPVDGFFAADFVKGGFFNEEGQLKDAVFRTVSDDRVVEQEFNADKRPASVKTRETKQRQSTSSAASVNQPNVRRTSPQNEWDVGDYSKSK